eukprot:TRINITY_DN8157_c0_g1_i1.p1 TRINITY_DN8157_c0_g1~~TRINITY_DN8157_c0_g1_i1.p1  ORF type:complete len:293 (-),score=16.16 TRINITY_DN8157_c0_g1_i1:10-888(-)
MRHKKNGKPWHSIVSGYVGGILGLTFAYPFDTLKVRLQNFPELSLVKCGVDMVKHEGFFSLWRGIIFPAMGYGLINAVVFGSYNFSRRYLVDLFQPDSLYPSIFAGMCAGTTSSVVRSPIERIKTVMQVNTLPNGRPFYKTSFHALLAILRTGGVRGLMLGLFSTTFREVAQYAVYYPAYEISKRALTPSDFDPETQTLSPFRVVVAGAIAGVIQWLPPIFCIDVIKTRMQTPTAGKTPYTGIWDCVVKSQRADGSRVWLKGLAPALLRAAPLHALIFLGYETSMRYLENNF